jgi:hypothetical protein
VKYSVHKSLIEEHFDGVSRSGPMTLLALFPANRIFMRINTTSFSFPVDPRSSREQVYSSSEKETQMKKIR